MNEKTVRLALIAMGYRESKPGHWLKPVGHVCFAYHEDKNKWTNYILLANGKIDVWERKEFSHELEKNGDYLHQLKYFEAYTRIVLAHNTESHFELSALDL